MIAIINYEAGNLASVSNALNRLQAEYIISSNASDLEKADGIIFPGVGHAKPAMESLRASGLVDWLKETDKPLLGICLGMQLLLDFSDEGGGTKGLSLIPGRLQEFDNSQHKVPQMGWNNCNSMKNHPLTTGLSTDSSFYFVHSYYAPPNEYTVATGSYSSDFSAIIARENIMGTQFHPEKSGDAGHQLLKNFLSHVDKK